MSVHFTRVGRNVVFVWIHCADVQIHCRDILIECNIFLYVFSSICRKLYTIFQPTFSRSNATRISSLRFLL